MSQIQQESPNIRITMWIPMKHVWMQVCLNACMCALVYFW
jgi:hypothetical protein